jgi:hypothetical protein
MDLERQMTTTEAPPEPMDVLSNEWCSYAIQVFQPKLEDCVVKSMDKSIVAIKDTDRAPSLVSPLCKISQRIFDFFFGNSLKCF